MGPCMPPLLLKLLHGTVIPSSASLIAGFGKWGPDAFSRRCQVLQLAVQVPEEEGVPEEFTFVQCCQCKKWRRLKVPAIALADWECSANPDPMCEHPCQGILRARLCACRPVSEP